jgi:hypothetical protein
MVCHCKCCGGKRSEILQRSPWKATFSALYGTYTVTLQELKAVIKAKTLVGQTNLPKQMVSKKFGGGRGAPPTKPQKLQRKRQCRPKFWPPWTFPPSRWSPETFRPLRAADMDNDASGTEATSNKESVPGKTVRPPPIILTSTTNVIELQKQLKIVVK